PYVRCTPRVLPTFFRQAVVTRIAHVPRPGEGAGHGVVGAQHAGDLAELLVVRHPAADDGKVAGDKGGRRHHVFAGIAGPQAGLQVDLTVEAEVGARTAGKRVERKQTRVRRVG